MIRKVLKRILWSAAGIVGLGVVVYVIAVLINWRDQAPSAAAQRLANLYGDRQAVAGADNSYVYLMGFEAPFGESPAAMGAKRVAWLETANATRTGDPLRGPLRRTRPAAVDEIMRQCSPDGSDCVAAFEQSARAFEEWTTSESWLLERYEALLAHPAWRELVPTNLSSPPPDFGAAVDGQRMLLMKAKAIADHGDASAVRGLLAGDVRFWRNVLESADTLTTKMIATAALQRHFEWGNLVVRGLPPESAVVALPEEWQVAITDSERSMLRPVAGEWRHTLSVLESFDRASADDTVFGLAAVDRIPARLYRRQATVNRYAEYFWSEYQTLNVPLDHFAAAANDASQIAASTVDGAFAESWVYNPVGSALIAVGVADFAGYGRRVADIEGTRRATLLAVTLRAAGVPTSDVAASLNATPWRNPYDDLSLQWDGARAAIVFRGLEPAPRGEHRIYY